MENTKMRINDIFCQWRNENRFFKEKKESKLKWPEGAVDFVHFTMVQIQEFLSNFKFWLGAFKKYVDMKGGLVFSVQGRSYVLACPVTITISYEFLYTFLNLSQPHLNFRA